jgi:hypothetical protein
MSRTRCPQFQWRHKWSSRAARRERSLGRRPHLNLSRQQPRHRRRVNQDRERRAAVAAAEVVAEVVRGRERLRHHPQSPQNIPPLERPQRKHPQ